MTFRSIPVNTPSLDGNEKKYLLECIESGWISSEGPFVERFEKGFAVSCGRKHGIAVSNGTVAIDIAIAVAEVGPGDEVILPTFTIISCVNEIVRRGAKPVFVDATADTWNMDVSQVESKINSRTKAIMAVHIYGHPVDMDPLLSLCAKYGLTLIEDSAEMHGQTYRGRQCGSFGHLSTFSFYPNKHVTTGEGGMILCDDDKLAEKCRSFRNLCFQPQRRFVHEEIGWNGRMTNLQAALGVAQLERLDQFVARKRRLGAFYYSELKHIEALEFQKIETDYSKNSYWVFGAVIRDGHRFDAKGAMEALAERGIGTRPFFWPLHEQPVLLKRGIILPETLPVAERIARRGFYIPSGLGTTEEELQVVVEQVKAVFAQ